MKDCNSEGTEQLRSRLNTRKGVDFMRYVISGKNIDVTEGLRTAITDKLGKLERYFTPDTEVHVTLSVEKERQKIEVTIPVKGKLAAPQNTPIIPNAATEGILRLK